MNLVRQLPLPTSMFGTNSVKEYYRHLNLENKNYNFTQTTEDMVLALLQKIDPSKAVGLDNVGGKFIKDSATELSLPVTQLINLSIKSSVFSEQCKLQN